MITNSLDAAVAVGRAAKPSSRAPGSWRERLGIVLQESEPEPGLTVRECVSLYAGYYSAPRDVDHTIALVGLDGQTG